MTFRIRHSIPLMYIFLLPACKEKVTQESLIKAALEIKLTQWRDQQTSTCRQKALTDAEKYVDSVLVSISLESKLDTISKPEKPVKPPKPEFKPKPDSVIVEKIYKKE